MASNNALGSLGVVSLAANGAKALFGLGQGIAGRMRQKSLWRERPLLGLTEGEKANDLLYNQMANATELPGEGRYIDKMDEAYAGGVYDAGRSATSSLGATQSAVDLASRKFSAIKDLASSFAEFKQQRMDALANWNQTKIGLENERFAVNKLDPWNMKMNEAVSQKQQGFGSFMGAVDSGIGTLGDLQGTQMYTDILKSMRPNLGGGIGGGGFQSAPMSNPYNPTANLNGTLSDMLKKIKVG